MRLFLRILFSFLLLPLCFLGAQAGVTARTIYVSPAGRDVNPGTEGKPFATLERARNEVRLIRRSSPGEAVTVVLGKGTYQRDSTFRLGSGDGGDSLAPVRYVGVGREAVRLTGGKELRAFRLLRDRSLLGRLDPACAGQVYVTALADEGITDAGTLASRGFGRPITPAALELFFNDNPMTLARWPNDGWTTIEDTISGARDSRFQYAGGRPERWTSSQDVWLHGYWTWDWAESYVRIDSIDTARKIIRTRAPHGVYGYSRGKRFYAQNILEELDSPGEYYVDRAAGKIYFWPPASLRGARVTASTVDSPLVVMANTAWVTLANLTIECTRGAGVVIEGGHDNSVAGCMIRNIGTVGVCVGRLEPLLAGLIADHTLFNVDGGRRNGVQSCDFQGCGEGGVILGGGDRMTLTPGENYVDNVRLMECSRWVRTYRPAIFIWGVGNRVSHSVISDLPHSAILYWGNDHRLEYNEVYDVCRETGDAGAFYQGRDWTQRGTQIRYNYFHDLRGVEGGEGFTDVMAVYMDDFASGTIVARNVFADAGRSVMIGGGRDNIVEENLFLNGHPALHVDARGRGWATFMADGPRSIMRERLSAIAGVREVYERRYPPLTRILEDEPALPKGDTVRNNVSYGGIWRELLDGVNDTLVAFIGNSVDEDPGFVSPAGKDFRLRSDATVLGRGFPAIPTERIGLYRDPYRKEVAARAHPIPGGIISVGGK
jgi:hypothetical protein